MSTDVAHAELVITGHFFRNPRLAGYWCLVSVAAILVFLVRPHALVGLAAIAVAVFAAQAALAVWLGVVIGPDAIDVPRSLLPAIPVLPFWRRRIPYSVLKDATALGHFAGFEAVGLATLDGASAVLFPSRQAKLDFFKCLQASKPDIKIYRAF